MGSSQADTQHCLVGARHLPTRPRGYQLLNHHQEPQGFLPFQGLPACLQHAHLPARSAAACLSCMLLVLSRGGCELLRSHMSCRQTCHPPLGEETSGRSECSGAPCAPGELTVRPAPAGHLHVGHCHVTGLLPPGTSGLCLLFSARLAAAELWPRPTSSGSMWQNGHVWNSAGTGEKEERAGIRPGSFTALIAFYPVNRGACVGSHTKPDSHITAEG